jgi:glyoxylase-like metal-dependent hydrolase (beta-lactamase superfamily II)
MPKAPLRVTPHVHSLWPEFEIELANGAKIPRFVTSYVIEGERLAVIDTAVTPAVSEIFAYIESIGRSPEDVEIVINTHCHFDHIGGNGVFLKQAKSRFYAHSLDQSMIET